MKTFKKKAKKLKKTLLSCFIHRIPCFKVCCLNPKRWLIILIVCLAAIYIITPYVGYNLILLRHLCIPFFDGENRQRCRRVCQAHPRGGGCYHEIDLIVDVIKIIEDVGIEYHLGFGTLLSVHRDGKISFCNDDTDLMLHIEGDTLSIYQSWKLRKELQKKGLIM